VGKEKSEKKSIGKNSRIYLKFLTVLFLDFVRTKWAELSASTQMR